MVQLDRDRMETVYVIETDMAVTPDDPSYDAEAFAGFVEALRAYLEANPHNDCARVEPIPAEQWTSPTRSEGESPSNLGKGSCFSSKSMLLMGRY
jgi:hypothetical protein